MQSKSSKSKIIFEVLRDRILVNRLRPGDVLGEVALAEEFGVSRTPVRQALQSLAALGLVEIRDGAGTFVTAIDQRTQRDAYQVRIALEKLALETCMDHISEAELDDFEERFRLFLTQLEEGAGHISLEVMAFTEWELHDLIVERSENTLIAPALEGLTAVMRRFQITYISGYLRAAREHLALIECMRRRDVEGAKRIMDEHLRARTEWRPAGEREAREAEDADERVDDAVAAVAVAAANVVADAAPADAAPADATIADAAPALASTPSEGGR